MDEYLNAKSMVTPGVAGGVVRLISNTCPMTRLPYKLSC